MELQDVAYKKSEFVETASGNKVSRQSTLCGSQNIVLNGRTILMPECMFRGDLSNIRVGKYCLIGERTVVRPAYKKFIKGIALIPMHIGDHVSIGKDSVVMAASVGSYVHIGNNAIVGRRAVLKDCCSILDDSVLLPDTVVPPFCVLAGNPAKVVGELPECTQELMMDATRSFYEHFIPENEAK